MDQRDAQIIEEVDITKLTRWWGVLRPTIRRLIEAVTPPTFWGSTVAYAPFVFSLLAAMTAVFIVFAIAGEAVASVLTAALAASAAVFAAISAISFVAYYVVNWRRISTADVLRANSSPKKRAQTLSNGVSVGQIIDTLHPQLADIERILTERPRYRRASTLNKLGFYGGLFAAFFAIVAVLAIYTEPDPSQRAESTPSASASEEQDGEENMAALVLYLFAPIAMIFYARRVRLLQVSAHELMERDPRPPIVYLRSFADDELAVWETEADPLARYWRKALSFLVGVDGMRRAFKPTQRLEETLADVARLFGPYIAIGEPGEKLPDAGAARAYVSHDAWREQVDTWIRRAQKLVMIGGVSPGVLWELEHILGHEARKPLLVFFPPTRPTALPGRSYGPSRTERVQAVLETIRRGGALETPDGFDPERCLCLTRDADGRLSAITSRRGDTNDDFHKAFIVAAATVSKRRFVSFSDLAARPSDATAREA